MSAARLAAQAEELRELAGSVQGSGVKAAANLAERLDVVANTLAARSRRARIHKGGDDLVRSLVPRFGEGGGDDHNPGWEDADEATRYEMAEDWGLPQDYHRIPVGPKSMQEVVRGLDNRTGESRTEPVRSIGDYDLAFADSKSPVYIQDGRARNMQASRRRAARPPLLDDLVGDGPMRDDLDADDELDLGDPFDYETTDGMPGQNERRNRPIDEYQGKRKEERILPYRGPHPYRGKKGTGGQGLDPLSEPGLASPEELKALTAGRRQDARVGGALRRLANEGDPRDAALLGRTLRSIRTGGRLGDFLSRAGASLEQYARGRLPSRRRTPARAARRELERIAFELGDSPSRPGPKTFKDAVNLHRDRDPNEPGNEVVRDQDLGGAGHDPRYRDRYNPPPEMPPMGRGAEEKFDFERSGDNPVDRRELDEALDGAQTQDHFAEDGDDDPMIDEGPEGGDDLALDEDLEGGDDLALDVDLDGVADLPRRRRGSPEFMSDALVGEDLDDTIDSEEPQRFSRDGESEDDEWESDPTPRNEVEGYTPEEEEGEEEEGEEEEGEEEEGEEEEGEEEEGEEEEGEKRKGDVEYASRRRRAARRPVVTIHRPGFVPDHLDGIWKQAAVRVASARRILTEDGRVAYPLIAATYRRLLAGGLKRSGGVAASNRPFDREERRVAGDRSPFDATGLGRPPQQTKNPTRDNANAFLREMIKRYGQHAWDRLFTQEELPQLPSSRVFSAVVLGVLQETKDGRWRLNPAYRGRMASRKIATGLDIRDVPLANQVASKLSRVAGGIGPALSRTFDAAACRAAGLTRQEWSEARRSGLLIAGRDGYRLNPNLYRVGDRTGAKKVNPWAVCHSSTGPRKTKKFERCVQDVKWQQRG